MKKISLSAVVILTSIGLISCGDNITITPDTPIETQAQAKKVCEPFIKYLECYVDKAPGAQKAQRKQILQDTRRRIENDTPSLIAQECTSFINFVRENPSVASSNWCFIEDSGVNPTPEKTAENPEPTPENTDANPAPTPENTDEVAQN